MLSLFIAPSKGGFNWLFTKLNKAFPVGPSGDGIQRALDGGVGGGGVGVIDERLVHQ